LQRERESPAQLARAFQVTKGAMTYTLQRLEQLRYVTLEPDPNDARAKIVRMTKAGRKARDAAVARVAPGMRKQIEHVGAAQFRAALPFLVRLREVLDAARD
jgi:DNA-binding MarR family transcriptional regulator